MISSNPSITTVSIHAPRVGRDGGRKRGGMARRGFNPRAPRGARLEPEDYDAELDDVSIHAPRVGRDLSAALGLRRYGVSIHAPRVGRDRERGYEIDVVTGFNPRAPRGARLRLGDNSVVNFEFQSTRPAWGATPAMADVPRAGGVSIHAPRVGRDGKA